MPVISDLEVPLSVDEVTASWGPRRARLASPRILDLIASVLSQVQSEHLIQPELAFRIWPVESSGPGWLELRGGSFIASPSLNHHLPAAAFVAAGVCTIGSAIEQRVSEGFAAGDRLRAVMLDEIGTLSLFRVSERVESEIQDEAERLGLEAGGALNPGEDGFDISQQAKVVELANGSSIGVSSTTAMLVPRKSISMVLGIGVRMPKWNRGERCALCAARTRCPHRHSPLVEVRV
jgi:hypothetical protein